MSLSPSSGQPILKKAAILEGAHNNVFHGGTFVTNADTPKKAKILDRLFKLVSRNAILNAGGRADKVECYPGTREEVIGKVEKWMDDIRNGSCTNRIMWLSGPAGAGKSAVCQTVAERCPTHEQQAANFFFFRGDQTRNRAQPLVPTLAYQLRRIYPKLDALLVDCLTADPLICDASIADQFHHLIAAPIQKLQQSSPIRETIVLFIDGLDECDDNMKQDEILTAIRSLVDMDHSPFLALIASRAEPHLLMSFNRLGTSLELIFLDDQYRPRDDIHRFVTAKFDEIKQLHHLRHLLPKHWPSQSDIDAIIDKSSSQFLYVATVMRFIQYSPDSPSLSLVTILQVRISAGHNPLAQVDAVYSYIFSKVTDIQKAKLIICAYLIIDLAKKEMNCHHIKTLRFGDSMQLIGYKHVDIVSLFSNLRAIIKVTANPLDLVFYHASLHDYLKDKDRSGKYHVDIGQIAAELSAICFQKIYDDDTFNRVARLCPLQYVEMATLELSNSLLAASTRKIYVRTGAVDYWDQVVQEIERLYLQSDKKLFEKLVQSWVRFLYLNHLSLCKDIWGLSPAAFRYYKWCHCIEGIKFKLKHGLAIGH